MSRDKNVWEKLNFLKWDHNAWSNFSGVVSLTAVAGLLGWLVVWAFNAQAADQRAQEQAKQFNTQFAHRCEAIPGSYTVIGDIDKCLVVTDGQVTVKFKEH